MHLSFSEASATEPSVELSATTASDVVAATVGVIDVAVSGTGFVTAAMIGAFAAESFSVEVGRSDGDGRDRGDDIDGAELDWDEDDSSTRMGVGSVVKLPISLKGPSDGVGTGFESRFGVAEEFCSGFPLDFPTRQLGSSPLSPPLPSCRSVALESSTRRMAKSSSLPAFQVATILLIAVLGLGTRRKVKGGLTGFECSFDKTGFAQKPGFFQCLFRLFVAGFEFFQKLLNVKIAILFN